MQNEVFFQNVFEIGRRNKVLNPSKMRGAYGKLMHLLQDTQSRTIAKSLGFSLYKDMLMVRPFLNDRNATPILDDERLVFATLFIATKDDLTGEHVERHIVDAQVSQKRRYRQELFEEYTQETSSSTDGDGTKSIS